MKKKILNIVIDILLFYIIFGVTDIIMIKVFSSKNFWLELGIYIIFYGIVFGGKSEILYLCKRIIKKSSVAEKECDEDK